MPATWARWRQREIRFGEEPAPPADDERWLCTYVNHCNG